MELDLTKNTREDNFAFSMCIATYLMLIAGFYISPFFFLAVLFLADINLTEKEDTFYDKQYNHLFSTAGNWIKWMIIGFALLILDIGLINNFNYDEVIKATDLNKLINLHPIQSFFNTNMEFEEMVHKIIFSSTGLDDTKQDLPSIFNLEVLNNLWTLDYKKAFLEGEKGAYNVGILVTTVLTIYVFAIKCLLKPIYKIIYGLICLLTKTEVN